MKKIVGIIAAVAMAASVFAVDISATLRMNGSLFDMSFADGAKPSILKLNTPAQDHRAWAQGGITVSGSSEKAGGQFLLDNYGEGQSVKIGKDITGEEEDIEFPVTTYGWNNFSLWIQPLDQLKINFGNVGYNSNTETISYSKIADSNGQGISVDIFPIEGLQISLEAYPGYGNPWANMGAAEGSKLAPSALFVSYGADFGKILALLDYEGNKVIQFAAGYSNTFGDINMFADVAFKYDGVAEKAKDLTIDAFMNTSFDALGLKAYIKYVNSLADSGVAGLDNEVSAMVRLDYALDPVNVYLQVSTGDVFIADGQKLSMTIKPGISFSVGAAGCDIAAEFTNVGGDPIKLSVPFSVSLGF